MKPAKHEARRQARIQDWDRMMAKINDRTTECKVAQRLQSGGYRRPGSNKRT